MTPTLCNTHSTSCRTHSVKVWSTQNVWKIYFFLQGLDCTTSPACSKNCTNSCIIIIFCMCVYVWPILCLLITCSSFYLIVSVLVGILPKAFYTYHSREWPFPSKRKSIRGFDLSLFQFYMCGPCETMLTLTSDLQNLICWTFWHFCKVWRQSFGRIAFTRMARHRQTDNISSPGCLQQLWTTLFE